MVHVLKVDPASMTKKFSAWPWCPLLDGERRW
jgi:hypothetical protein